MKKIKSIRSMLGNVALTSFVVASLAAPGTAAALTWDMGTNDGCGGGSPEPSCAAANTMGNARVYSNGGVKLTASAYSDTGAQNNGDTTSRPIETAYLGHYSGNGLGVTNADFVDPPGGGYNPQDPGEDASPEHAIDNNGRIDSVQLAFDAPVKLTNLYFGWTNGDSGDADFSVLYSNSPTLVGNKYNQLISTGGWTLLGSFNASGTGDKALGTGSIFASNWLVVAFGPYNSCTSGCDAGDDYFKLKSATGTKRVPEPGSLALLGLGLAGLGFTRRKRS